MKGRVRVTGAILLAFVMLMNMGVPVFAESTDGAQCEIPEHSHSDACYGEDDALVCEADEHSHTEACYSTPESPSLPQEDPSEAPSSAETAETEEEDTEDSSPESNDGLETEQTATITGFAELGMEYTPKVVAVGTALEDLTFPESLAATLLPGGEGAVAEDISIDVAAWACADEGGYIADINGVLYTFVPEVNVPEGIVLAEDVNLPSIKVLVGTMGIMPLGLSETTTLTFTAGVSASGAGYSWNGNTLSLTNFTWHTNPTVSSSLPAPAGYTGASMINAIELPANSTIVLSGTNSIQNNSGSGNSFSAGIYCAGNLTIRGSNSSSDKLTAKPGSSNSGSTFGIYAAGTLNMSYADITVTGTGANQNSYGIRSASSLTINQAIVNSSSNSANGGYFSHGISSGGAVSITSSTVTATGGNVAAARTSTTHSVGIFAQSMLTINSGTVRAYGGNLPGHVLASNSWAASLGTYSAGITIIGGNVTAIGGTMNTSTTHDNYAIYSIGMYSGNGSISITGGTVNATGGSATGSTGNLFRSAGIYQSGGTYAFDISGASTTVTATGGGSTSTTSYGHVYGLWASSGPLSIQNAKVTAQTGKTNEQSMGIHCYSQNITITGSAEVTATANTTPSMSFGVYRGNTNTLTIGSASGNQPTVTFTGGEAGGNGRGVTGAGTCTIYSGATVTAQSTKPTAGNRSAFETAPTLSYNASTHVADIRAADGETFIKLADTASAPYAKITFRTQLYPRVVSSDGTVSGDEESFGLGKATRSENWSGTLIPAKGYKLPENITVTVADETLMLTADYTYDAATGVVTVFVAKVTGDIVVTATGEAIPYTLRFDTQGGQTTDEPIEITVGAKPDQLTPATRAGFTFMGYNTIPGGGAMLFDETGTVINDIEGYTDASGNWIRAADTVIYARWAPKTVPVTFNKDGGNGGSDGVTATPLNPFAVSVAIPTKVSTIFEGYYTEPNGGGTQFFDAFGYPTRAIWTITTETATLYAKWRTTRYPLSLQNGSFEMPGITASWANLNDADSNEVVQWHTTASDRRIEFGNVNYGAPHGTTTAADGVQYAELNANMVGSLYQTISTVGGEELSWGLSHRGRSGTDVMQVWIGTPAQIDQAISQYLNANAKKDSQKNLVSNVSSSLLRAIQQKAETKNGAPYNKADISSNNTRWYEYTGTYTVPAGQGETVFAFISVSSTGGVSYGNLLDKIYFQSDPPKPSFPLIVSPSVGGVVDVYVNDELVGTTEGGNTVILYPEEGDKVDVVPRPAEGYEEIGKIEDGEFIPKDEYEGDDTGWIVDGDKEVQFVFAKSGTVIYNAQGGSYQDGNGEARELVELQMGGDNTTETVGEPTREGYIFAGWEVVGANPVVILEDGAVIRYELDGSDPFMRVYADDNFGEPLYVVDMSPTSTVDYIVLNAKWDPIPIPGVTFLFDLNDGDNDVKATLNGTTTAQINEQNGNTLGHHIGLSYVSGNMVVGAAPAAVPVSPMTLYTGVPERSGYLFTGWEESSTARAEGATYGYTVAGYSASLQKPGGSPAPLAAGETVTLVAQWEVRTAETPVITAQPQDKTLVYGYASGGTLGLDVKPLAMADETLTYQWYQSLDGTTTGGTPINGATGPQFAFPTGNDAGTYQYYCVVTSTVDDLEDIEPATATSDLCTVTVNPRPVQLTWDPNSYNYDGTEKTVVATVQNIVPGDTVTVTAYTNNKKTDAGDYIAAATGLSNPNYTLVGATGTNKAWSITKRVLTITANNNSITYGDAPSANGYAVSGFVTGDSLSNVTITGTVNYTFSYNQYGDVGDYTITPGVGGLYTQNYTFAAANGTLTVVPLPVVLAWGEGDFTYDGTQKKIEATVQNAVNGDSVTVTGYTNNEKTGAGDYEAEAVTLSNPNYTLERGTGITQEWLIRKKKPILETSTTTINTAGDAEVGYTYDGDGTVSAESDNPMLDVRVEPGSGGGTLTITPDAGMTGDSTVEITLKAGEGNNYTEADDVVIQVIIHDGEVSVLANGYSGVYDAAGHMIAVNLSDNLAATGATVTYSETDGGTYGANIPKTDAGEHTIYYRIEGGTLVGTIDGSATISISKKPIAITAKNHTITYGAVPANDGVYDLPTGALAGTDTLAQVIGSVAYANTYAQYGNAGTYPEDIAISASDTTAVKYGNYAITWNAGTLYVVPKVVNITWTNTGPFTYDGSEHSVIPGTTDTVNGDSITFETVNDKAVGAGEYDAEVTGITGPKAGNYTLEGASGTQEKWEIEKGAKAAPGKQTEGGVLGSEDETVDGKNDGKITDVDLTMEYSDDGGTTWYDVTPEMIDGGGIGDLPPGDYKVRYKETDNYGESPSTTITIGGGVAKDFTITLDAPLFDTEAVGYTRPAAKPLTITNTGNWESTLTGVQLSGTHADKFDLVDGSDTVPEGGFITDWTVQPKAGIAVGSYSVTVTATYNGGATVTATVWFHVVKRKVPAPDVAVIDEVYEGDKDGKITGLDNTMEYSPDGGTTWIPITDDMLDSDGNLTGLAPGDYLVRYAETDETEASPAASVTVGPGVSKTYGLRMEVPVFGTVTEGYSRPGTQDITITSMGNRDSSIYSITCSKDAWFEVAGGMGGMARQTVICTVTAGGTCTDFTLQPRANLAAGTYTATITITYNDGATATGETRFVVEPLPTKDDNSNGNSGSEIESGSGVQTGDSSNLLLWVMLLLLAGGILVGWGIWAKHKKKAAPATSSMDVAGNTEVEPTDSGRNDE